VPCCGIFLVALVAFASLYGEALARGNLGRLYHGIDYKNEFCGIDAKVRYQPYLLWCESKASIAGTDFKLSLGQPICVSECPSSSSPKTELTAIASACQLAEGWSPGGELYTSKALFSRYCVPDTKYGDMATDIFGDQLSDISEEVMDGVASLPAAWPVLLGSFLFAVAMGYAYLFALKFCAEPLIWLSMLLSIVGFGLLGMYLFVNAGQLGSMISATVQNPTQKSMLDSKNEEMITKGAACICWALGLIMVCLACCFKHSIEVASACVVVACEAIFEMPSLLLTPVFKALFKGAIVLVLLLGFFMLYSTADITPAGGGLYRTFTFTPLEKGKLLFYMFVAFWILAFMNALYQFIVAYAVVEYYYTPYDSDGDKDVDGCGAARDGLEVGLLYHGGSLAFGSLLVAILHVLQKAIEYAEYKNQHEGGDNPIIKCILCCCASCVTCCKDIVEFVNKNAYIGIAINSENFCDAARHALEMIEELWSSMAILNGATYVFTTFGTIIIMLACAGFTYAISSHSTFADSQSQFYVSDPVAVMAVSMCIAFVVALCFMNIVDMASDTLLYCYGVDMQSGKESSGHAPHGLAELVQSHHKPAE